MDEAKITEECTNMFRQYNGADQAIVLAISHILSKLDPDHQVEVIDSLLNAASVVVENPDVGTQFTDGFNGVIDSIVNHLTND